MTKYTVVVEVTKTEEFKIEASSDQEAFKKAREHCKLDYHNDFDIIDIYVEDEISDHPEEKEATQWMRDAMDCVPYT